MGDNMLTIIVLKFSKSRMIGNEKKKKSMKYPQNYFISLTETNRQHSRNLERKIILNLYFLLVVIKYIGEMF